MADNHVVIDGDGLAYRAALGSDVEYAYKKVIKEVEWIASETLASKFTFCLTGDMNFRYDVFRPYKGNRSQDDKPPALATIRAFCMKELNAKLVAKLEADDLLGIMGTTESDDTIILSSNDKDLKQIPGYLFNPGHPELGIVKTTKTQGDRFFFYQLLAGDTTDNYPGIPGIGPKKTEAFLDKYFHEDDLYGTWLKVLELYDFHHLPQSYALMQARCARILRNGEFDTSKDKVNLWQPKKADSYL